jgi:hypothetical protein
MQWLYRESSKDILRQPIEDMPAVAFRGPMDGWQFTCDPRRMEVYVQGHGPYLRSGFVTRPGGGEAIYIWSP